MSMYVVCFPFSFKLFVNIETFNNNCDVPVDGIVVSKNSAEYKLVYRLINFVLIS